jgi:hypothetical protein
MNASRPHEEYIGQRRVFNGCEQICMGPCAACGHPVWRSMNAPVSDEFVYHTQSAHCRDRLSLVRWGIR